MPIRPPASETNATWTPKPYYFLRPFFLRPLGNIGLVVILIAFVSVAGSVAQDAPKPSGQNESLGKQVSGAAKKPVQLFNLLDRKSIFFPDIAADTNPLSPGQKFEIFVDNSISVHTILWSGLGSAVGQADNSPTGFGQGWDAYGKRFGSSMARQASSQFFGTFVLASALHQDPRFFPEVNPGFFQAVKYSVQRLFVTRSDDGLRVMNTSGLVGPLLGEGLANAYWPDPNRTVGDTFFRYGLDLATRTGGNMLREYWPVLYRKMGHRTSVQRASR
jgi:hypothetical protein